MENRDSLAEAAGICPEIRFAGEDGNEYIIEPPKIGHLTEFEKFAKEERHTRELAYIREVRELVSEETVAEMVRELKSEFTGWVSKLLSPAGMQYMIWLRMLKNHPDLSLEDAGKVVPISVLKEQQVSVQELLGMDLFMARGEAGNATAAEIQESPGQESLPYSPTSTVSGQETY